MKNWKLILIFCFFVCFSFLLVFRLYHLQIERGDYYQALALGQQVSFKEIGEQRGGIFLGPGIPLAQNEKKNIVYIFPEKIPEGKLNETTKVLSEIFGEKEEKLLALMKENKIQKRELSKEAWESLISDGLKGVYPDTIWSRYYPQKRLASHVVGFFSSEAGGQYGLEGYYNEVLKGDKGLEQSGRSPLGYLAWFGGESQSKNESLKGAALYLSLDYNLQYFSEKLLKKADETWQIDSGQIIVSEPASGKILALAAFPDFDPNAYYEEKKLDVFLNPALQKLFEPGSVFKPITFAAGLEENLIEPKTAYEDKGFVEIVGPPIYNFQKRIWGKQTMTDVLEESINTGAVFVEQKLGEELFLKYLERFGFFEGTGLDLQGEIFSLNKSLRTGHRRDVAVSSFGQGVEITPAQIVRAFGAIANGGDLMKPYVVEKIVKSNGEVFENKPVVQRKVISPETAAELTSMLVSVVENGSARRTKIKGYYIAAKTGTAQVPLETGGYSEDETIQSCIGFLPAFEPKVLIFIKLDNPKGIGEAGRSVVPLFKELAEYVINYWQLAPNYE